MLFNFVAIGAFAAIAYAAPYSSASSKLVTSSIKPASTSTGHPGSTSSSAAKNLPTALAASLAKQMHSEVTAVDRFTDLLSEHGAFLTDQRKIQERVVFDFNAATAAPNSTGGRILVANEKNYPILTELGIAGAVAFLNPCSMNTPHTHPRATELLTLVKGERLQTGLMLENGFHPTTAGGLTTQVAAELSTFQATVFPQGSIHFQFNPTCEEAIFVAALSSSDPGTSQVAQNFFFQDERIVDITLGQPEELNGKDIADFRKNLPANLVQAMDSCIATCKGKGIVI